MKPWVLLPDVILIGDLLLILDLVATWAIGKHRRLWSPRKLTVVVGMQVLALLALTIAAFCPSQLMRAVPSIAWQREAREADVAIVFGFGLGDGIGNTVTSGASNRALLDWTVTNTDAPTILVQEGVWLAACESAVESCEFAGRKLVRMHRDDPKIRVDTFEAACCAGDRLQAMSARKVVVVAHHLQLAQAAWDLQKVLSRRGLAVELVIPELPPTPFPGSWRQWQTASPYIYKLIALVVARPRDFLRYLFQRIPATCPAPCGATCAPAGIAGR